MHTDLFVFFNAWPCSFKGVSLGIDEDSDLTEEIQLAVDRIERRTGPGAGAKNIKPAMKKIK